MFNLNIYPKSYYSNIGLVLILFILMFLPGTLSGGSGIPPTPTAQSDDLIIKSATVRYIPDMDLLLFEQFVEGTAGGPVPKARGELDGAPVLAYVFVTDLKPETVGFGPVAGGILALAVTVHPDFDDTPLWDENGDSIYDNDGAIYHSHWVVLVTDKRVAGGLSVGQFQKGDPAVVLPPTNPGMSIYLDSPGYPVNLKDNRLQVTVPAFRLKRITNFNFDAVTAYLQVNTSDKERPMLGVYKIYDVLSDDLSLPFRVESK